MSSQQEQILEKMVAAYESRHLDMHAILDNPLFKELSLSERIAFIQKYKDRLGTKPRFRASLIARGAMDGAFGLGLFNAVNQLGLGVGVKGLLSGPNLAKIGLAGAMGAGLGASVGLGASLTKYLKDRKAAAGIRDHNPEDSLVNSTLPNGKLDTPSYTSNKYLETIAHGWNEVSDDNVDDIVASMAATKARR